MQQTYGDRVDIVGVAGRDDLEQVNRFIDERGVAAFEHVFDRDGEIWQAFGVRSQPAFVFIDVDGNAERILGSMGQSGIADRLDALLAA